MHCSQHYDLFTHFNITHEIYYCCEMLFIIDNLILLYNLMIQREIMNFLLHRFH